MDAKKLKYTTKIYNKHIKKRPQQNPNHRQERCPPPPPPTVLSSCRTHRYLKGMEPAQCPHLKIPMHCVVQLNPKGYGYEEWR